MSGFASIRHPDACQSGRVQAVKPCAPRLGGLSSVGLLVGLLFGLADAADVPPGTLPGGAKAIAPATPNLPPGVARAMQEGRFAEAAAGLEKLASESTDAWARGYFDLVRGVALRLDGRLDEARGVLASAISANPKGPWAPKLRAELAAVELASGKPREAEALARGEVELLLSGDRKDRLAETFRAFALRLLSSDDPSPGSTPRPLTSCSSRPGHWRGRDAPLSLAVRDGECQPEPPIRPPEPRTSFRVM